MAKANDAGATEALKVLVVGATGHVGSKVTVLLADRGHDVTALVRSKGATIRDPHSGPIKYVVGDLNDEASLRRALRGIDVVVSTANGLLPQRPGDSVVGVNDAAVRLVGLCEEAGVRRFVQSSTPTFVHDDRIPELRGKRRIEERLASSTMQTVVIRNPAFMDVFLVMGGCAQAEDRSLHATTKRDFGFTKFWKVLTGNLVKRYGLFLAPGGADHGTPTISTRDVAELLYGGALVDCPDRHLLLEAGGPQWLTWREIADTLGRKLGRRRVRVVPIPAWFARLNCRLATPFSASVANVFAMMSFVADFQPTTWAASTATALKTLHAPTQLTLADYLDQNVPDGKDD